MGKKPTIFANEVIQRVAKQVDPAVTLREEDYDLIRDTFRKAGGSWVSLVQGDLVTVQLLKNTVKVWIARNAKASKGS